MRLWAALLAALVLAGCAEEAGKPADPDEDKFDAVDLMSGKGLVRGVVIDASIVPIEGAKIELGDTGLSTRSDANGAFMIKDVAPGPYFLKVSKAGFTDTQSSVQVEADEGRPDIVRVLLERDLANIPTWETLVYEGFLQCSFRVVVGANVCGVGEVADMPLDNPIVVHPLQGPPTYAQTEMVWQSTQPLGDSLKLIYSWGDCSGFYCDHAIVGTSPLVLTADAELLAQIHAEPADPDRPGLMVRVFGAEAEAAAGSGVGATLEQSFTHYTTVFYGTQPYEGWTFLEDGEYKMPE